jgi:hypothetical protein
MLYVFAFMVILFLFMSKLKREQREARVKVQVEIRHDVCAFPSRKKMSIEDYMDASSRMVVSTIP